jgi:hypothetical protein
MSSILKRCTTALTTPPQVPEKLQKDSQNSLANDWLMKDPFASIKFKINPVDAVFLTREELDAIRAKQIRIERIDQVRDIFLFCCYTGLAFSNVKTLGPEHLPQDNDGCW